MSTVSFFVPGTPAPQGSMNAFPFRRRGGRLGVHVAHSNAQTIPWREAVQTAATVEMRGRPLLDCAAYATVMFYFERPASHFLRSGALKASAPLYPSVRGLGYDLDKLARAILDSLSKIVYVDDVRVVDLTVRKRFSEVAGAQISVGPMKQVR